MKKLSIITPTYNRKKLIMNAVNSFLNSPPAKWKVEMIIIDDGSTDGTKELFKKSISKVKYFYFKKNRGVNVTRNEGISKASGDYILFLDSDDALVSDWGKILDEYANKLSYINFFGTADRKNLKKMYFVPKGGKYNYKDWLAGIINGEFLPIVKRDIFKKNYFDVSHFAFEGFFWNRIIKAFGVNVFDKVLRLYSFDSENRISKELLKPEKAQKRASDYDMYIREFREDYLKYELYKQYSNILFSAAAYHLLSDHMNKGRELLKESLSKHFSFKILLIFILSYVGHTTFLKAYELLVTYGP